MKRRYHIHPPGIVYAVCVLLIGFAAMNGQNNLLFWVFGVLFAGLVISGVVSGAMMLGVRIRRLDPHHGAVGEPLLVRYELTNHNRLIPIFNVHIEERPHSSPHRRRNGWQHFMSPARSWVMHVGPGETVHGDAVFWPQRRGEVHFGEVRIWTTFPFGIIKKSVSRSIPHHTLIYPRICRLRRDLFRIIDAPAMLGVKLSQRSGPGDDYYGMREYRHGDSIRNIAWKRSALLDELVCIDRSMPSPPRIRIVLDLRTPTDQLRIGSSEQWTARELEERALSLAASILRAAEREGFETGLSVLGTDLPRFAVRRSHWHLGKLMAALAGIDFDAERNVHSHTPPIGASSAKPSRQADLWTSGLADCLTNESHTALIVIHPDRSEIIHSRENVVYLTGRQLDDLSLGPAGWDQTGVGGQRFSIGGLDETARTGSREHAGKGAAA